MRQNEKILRYLTVRTDEALKRAARRQPADGAAPGAPRDEHEAGSASMSADLGADGEDI